MFAYEGLDIYKRSVSFNLQIRSYLDHNKIDFPTENQLRRAALSIVLNIAEGSGRFTKPDIRRFYIISRSSVFECAAILEMVHKESKISNKLYKSLVSEAEQLSRILFTMINNLSKKI